jgi:hypothetical protein
MARLSRREHHGVDRAARLDRGFKRFAMQRDEGFVTDEDKAPGHFHQILHALRHFCALGVVGFHQKPLAELFIFRTEVRLDL